VKRSGTKSKHRFDFEIAGDAVDFAAPAEAEIDFDIVLERLFSAERLDEYLPRLKECYAAPAIASPGGDKRHGRHIRKKQTLRAAAKSSGRRNSHDTVQAIPR